MEVEEKEVDKEVDEKVDHGVQIEKELGPSYWEHQHFQLRGK